MHCRCVFAVVFSLSLGSMLFAANYGKISGIVKDSETGEPVAGANVFIENTSLGASTDLDGRYVILQVPPGVYDVKTEFIGYKPVVVQSVRVSSDRIAIVDFTIQSVIIESTDIVVVVAQRPVIEKDIAATTRIVSSDEIKNIPASTLTDILSIQPGVVNSGGLHFRGGRSGEVVYYVDGMPVVDPLFSSTNTSEILNKDIISEMQVISGTYSAEYGNAMSGIINITTKSGSKNLGIDFDAKYNVPGIEQATTDNNRKLLRASLSGALPISSDMYFVLSGKFDDRDNYLPWGYRRVYSGFAKLTYNLSQSLKVTSSLSVSDGKQKSYDHSFKYIPDSVLTEPNTQNVVAQIGMTHTLSDKMFYTLMLYGNSDYYDSGDYDWRTDLNETYRRDDNNEFYLQNRRGNYEKTTQITYGLKGDLLWQINNYNEIKTGFELRQHRLDRFRIAAPYRVYYTLDDYVKEPFEAAAYVQDKVNFSSIILSLGLRFDLTDTNSDYWYSPYDLLTGDPSLKRSSEIHTQISPRLGISYPVSETTVFHFGYGHYFQRAAYTYTYRMITDDDYDESLLRSLNSGNGLYGNPDLKPEKQIGYEFGLSHQFAEEYLLNLSVYSKKILNYVGTRTFFAGDISPETGIEYDESFTVHINEDFGYNNGVELQLRKMRGRYIIGTVSYTYSVAEGSSSGPLERVGVEDANRQSLKFFPLDFDQRHTVNANVSLQFMEGDAPSYFGFLENMKFSFLFQYGSGLPYTKGIRGATEPYEINNKRLPANWTLDLIVDKRIDLGTLSLFPYVEIFNLTDRKNVLRVDPFTGEPDYIEGRTKDWAADPENFGAPRLIYFGLRLQY